MWTKTVMKENVPGSFPYTTDVFAFKRNAEKVGEDLNGMFAGEGDAFRTHRSFKRVSEGMPAHLGGGHEEQVGSYPIIGVNTFFNPQGNAQVEIEMARSTEEEKQSQLARPADFRAATPSKRRSGWRNCSRQSSKTATSSPCATARWGRSPTRCI